MEIKPLDNYKEREETIKSLIKENEMMRSALKTIIDIEMTDEEAKEFSF